MSEPDEPTAFFDADGDALVPTPWAQGPWGATVSGHIMGGLLGWAVERAGGDADLVPARLTVDLLRPTAMAPLRVETSVRREGKRIKVVDAEVLQNGTVVSRASSVFLRRGDHPDGEVWGSPTVMPPIPDDSAVSTDQMPFVLWAFGSDTEAGTLGGTGTEWQQAGLRKFAWVRELRPLITGESMTPFVRVALAGDVTSALTHWGTGGLRYINADFTMTLSRLPDGPYIGLASDGHHGSDGIASGSATLFDRHGPIGHSIAIALAQPPGSFRPPGRLGLK
ncbi:MAG: thioesterase family protein [Mycobacterium sp.]